jgi:hypothetical protein
MPVVLRHKGHRFLFFSNEGDPREPPHVHVRQGDRRAKFWLDPVALAENFGYAGHELQELAKVVAANRELIQRTWHEYFGD